MTFPIFTTDKEKTSAQMPLQMKTVFQLADKVAVLKAKLELSGDEWTLGFFTFQTLVEIVKETEPGPSFSQAMLSPMSAFKRV